MSMQYLKVTKLKNNPDNPRLIKEEQFKNLCESLKENIDYFEARPILCNTKLVIFAGNQRFKAAKAIGMKEVPCIIMDISEDRQTELMLRDNRTNGVWDKEELPKYGDLLEKVGFTDEELFLESTAEDKSTQEAIEDEVPDGSTIEPFCKKGDLWQLGKHRLLCGDCTDALNVKKLLGDEKPTLIVTDPPYGVNYDPTWRNGYGLGVGKRSLGKVKNDDIIDWSGAFALFDAPVMYVWHAGKYAAQVAESLIKCGYDIISQIIWAKQHFALSRGDYHWQHEPCWYAVKKGHQHNWQGKRDQATVWEIKSNNSFGNAKKEETWGHGTQKPVECMLRPIVNNSKEGGLIVDCFLGSGTTIIACEQSGRICYGCELDERYCDIIVRRWEKLTNEKAVLL
jgi:DNA modification methylase